MPLNKDETRVTLTQAELNFLSERLEGYRTTPEHQSLWDKVWKAQGRLYRQGFRKPNGSNSRPA